MIVQIYTSRHTTEIFLRGGGAPHPPPDALIRMPTFIVKLINSAMDESISSAATRNIADQERERGILVIN